MTLWVGPIGRDLTLLHQVKCPSLRMNGPDDLFTRICFAPITDIHRIRRHVRLAIGRYNRLRRMHCERHNMNCEQTVRPPRRDRSKFHSGASELPCLPHNKKHQIRSRGVLANELISIVGAT